jgi:hypothetical protein
MRAVLLLLLVAPSSIGLLQAGAWAAMETLAGARSNAELIDRRILQVRNAAEDVSGSPLHTGPPEAVPQVVGRPSGGSTLDDCTDCTASTDSGPFALSLSPGVWLLFAGVIGMAFVARRTRVDPPDNAG